LKVNTGRISKRDYQYDCLDKENTLSLSSGP
jgi:hypothetical protein